jgi:outer membrane protein OmpA-like peptidoglycan-associated protein
VEALERVRALRLDVKRSPGGRRVRAEAGPLEAGRVHAFPLPLAQPGVARFSGRLTVETRDGEGSMPLDVEVELLPLLRLDIAREDVDLEARELRLEASRPLEKVKISVISDTGAPLGTTERAAQTDAQGRVVARWEQTPGRVLRISVQGTDRHGFFAGVDLHPWQIDIPHEDVEFPTGEARIPKDEVPKLEASLEKLAAALERYGELAEGVTVFVAGHTDTVGDAEANLDLSERRARAIGAWFREAGLRVPIRFAGFGESMLLVDTPDATDEPRNRRAEYIVAIDPPVFEGRSVRWRSL